MRAKIFSVSVLIIFFLSILSLVILSPLVNSPDEQANRVFASQFATAGDFRLESAVPDEVADVVHPRSSFVHSGAIVPVSFFGLPILSGLVSKLGGVGAMLFITPILAVLALCAMYAIVTVITHSRSLAVLSSIFLAIHPAFWYYSARTMMHNVGFVSLLILAVWSWVVKPFSKSWLNFTLAGFLFAVAISFRLSEIVWLLPAVVALFIYSNLHQKRFLLQPAIFFIIPVLVVGALYGYLTLKTYGSWVTTGYTLKGLSPGDTPSDVLDPIVASIPFSNLFFPFGIHESNIANNAWDYGFRLYPWMSVLSIIGFLIFLKDKRTRPYAIFTAIISIWLIVVYGSWQFHDNPDPDVLTLGNSYARYWLPIFVLAAPMSAVALQKIASLVASTRKKNIFLAGITTLCVFLSFYLATFGADGFVLTRKNLALFELKRNEILLATPPNAIIITDMADKYLWPDRQVVVPLRHEQTYASISTLLESAPLYYFGITLPTEDLEYLNASLLSGVPARIEPVLTIYDETLYLIISL